MNFKEFFEGYGVPLVIVDVQPAYNNYCRRILPRLFSFLNKHKGNTIAFYNGEELGMDSKHDVAEYYLENGVSEEKINEINFTEKTYAFFRSWMDQGVDLHVIIKVLRYLVVNKMTDTREIESLQQLLGHEYQNFMEDDPIYLPQINIAQLKSGFNNCYLCGGGEHECLKEIQILLSVFNIKYTLVRDFIY
jgi:hypothetical protein